MSPRVTVLMAVHNGEQYVRQSIQSILGQTFEDFELLVVDDASTDGTAAIVESFGDGRIRVLRNERNVGQVPSLNRGLRESRGPYVARIDADDTSKPTRLQRQVEVLDAQQHVALVGTWVDAVDERGRRLGSLRQVLDDYVDFLYRTLVMQVYISHPAAMYRRDEVLALGGYDEEAAPSEDKDLWRKLALERREARIVAEPLVLYRVHAEQLSQTQTERQLRLDAESQDRFLAQLAPGVAVTAVRQLLAGDPAAWERDAHETVRDLGAVLAGARTRLRLDDDEARRLAERIAARMLEVASAQPWKSGARLVAAEAIARLPEHRREAARRSLAAAFVRAPARAALRRSAKMLAAGGKALPLHERARRIPLVRRLYSRAIGNR
ncbi:MAG: glycosyltransferase family 2 protein [Actinobacteria bacterium]|nr:MAG: glycosyltransferase family 2 protein [Actinomycetota bacterium]